MRESRKVKGGGQTQHYTEFGAGAASEAGVSPASPTPTPIIFSGAFDFLRYSNIFIINLLF